MPAAASQAKVRRLEKAKMDWMLHSWVAMGGHPDQFPGMILETLTEPQKFELVAELNAA